MYKRSLILAALMLSLCFEQAAFGADQAAQTRKLSALLEQIWQYQLSVDPIKATRYQNNRYNDKLKDLSPEALKANVQRNQQFLARLKEIDDSELNHQQKINKLMQMRELQNDIDLYHYNAHYMPITSESGFYSSLAFLPASAPFKTEQDYRNYLARLAEFPRYFDQQIAWMKKGIELSLIHI